MTRIVKVVTGLQLWSFNRIQSGRYRSGISAQQCKCYRAISIIFRAKHCQQNGLTIQPSQQWWHRKCKATALSRKRNKFSGVKNERSVRYDIAWSRARQWVAYMKNFMILNLLTACRSVETPLWLRLTTDTSGAFDSWHACNEWVSATWVNGFTKQMTQSANMPMSAWPEQHHHVPNN